MKSILRITILALATVSAVGASAQSNDTGRGEPGAGRGGDGTYSRTYDNDYPRYRIINGERHCAVTVRRGYDAQIFYYRCERPH